MEEPLEVRYVFMMLLAIADQAGDVIGTDVAIARRINMAVPEFKECVEVLMQPDQDSNSQEQEGRRVVESSGSRGYHLVNYLAYRGLKTTEDRREYMKNYMAERRKKDAVSKTEHSVNTCKLPLADVKQADAEAKGDAEALPEANASSSAEPTARVESGGVVDSFHALCPSLPKVRDLTEARKTAIRARWKASKGRHLEWFKELFAAAEVSDFLTGRDGRWPGCDFDWLMKPANAQKVLEGIYSNERRRAAPGKQSPHGKPPEERRYEDETL